MDISVSTSVVQQFNHSDHSTFLSQFKVGGSESEDRSSIINYEHCNMIRSSKSVIQIRNNFKSGLFYYRLL